MRKIMSLIMATLFTVSMGLFSACQYDAPKSIIGAQLNDKGELILTYSDNTTQNLGVVKGEDGKDGENGLNGKDGIDGVDGTNGKDGLVLTACEHSYDDWEVQLSPTCTSIGYNTRTCSLCGDLEYQFVEAIGHTYKNPVDIINTCEQHLVNKTCATCGDTTLVEAEVEHDFGDGSVCIDCGIELWQTHFIESEEYIEEIQGWFYWWNKDRTYAAVIALDPLTFKYSFRGCSNSPKHVVLPKYFQGKLISRIGSEMYGGGFSRNPSLETIIIPNTIGVIYPSSFLGCTSLTSVFFEGTPIIQQRAFRDCDNMTLYYYSKEQPTEEGNYWHYVNGEPVIWE